MRFMCDFMEIAAENYLVKHRNAKGAITGAKVDLVFPFGCNETISVLVKTLFKFKLGKPAFVFFHLPKVYNHLVKSFARQWM